MNVLDLHGRIVDQHPHRKCKSAQRHCVDSLPEKVQCYDGGQNCQRN